MLYSSEKELGENKDVFFTFVLKYIIIIIIH